MLKCLYIFSLAQRQNNLEPLYHELTECLLKKGMLLPLTFPDKLQGRAARAFQVKAQDHGIHRGHCRGNRLWSMRMRLNGKFDRDALFFGGFYFTSARF